MSSLIELFEFRTGDAVYRYTTRGQDRLWDGHSWVGTPLTRSNITNSTEMARNDVRIEFPLGHEFAMKFLGYGPDQATTLTLRRNRYNDPDDFYVCWKGRVADCDATDRIITVVCQSILNAAQNAGLIARMQKFCRRVLYNRGCNVDKELHAALTEVSAIDSRMRVLTCPSISLLPDNWFTGGMIELPNGALRYIVKSVGDQITLWRPSPEINNLIIESAPLTPILKLFPGCDGSLSTCENKFDNLDNNGAFYWIPDSNPFGGGNVF